VFDFDASLILYGLAGSALVHAGESVGLATAEEGFADRGYLSDGKLCPRTDTRSMLTDHERASKQALSMVINGTVTSIDNIEVKVMPDTICIHGDNPDALAFARNIRESLAGAGIQIMAPYTNYKPVSPGKQA
jgi:5-oxoprolinase (ATP-hydrolysing) subunit A